MAFWRMTWFVAWRRDNFQAKCEPLDVAICGSFVMEKPGRLEKV